MNDYCNNSILSFHHLSEAVWTHLQSSVEWVFLLPGSWPQTSNACHQGKTFIYNHCVWRICLSHVKVYITYNSSIIKVDYSFFLCLSYITVIRWLGPANGSSGGYCQGTACRATAGPGPVVPSGWSLTWESASAEGWAQGEKANTSAHTQTHRLFSFQKQHINNDACFFSILNLFAKDSRVQNGGYDQLRDSALCCLWLWIRKWAGEVVSFICLPGQTAHRHRPCMQVCFLRYCFKHPQSDCVHTNDVLLA